MLDAITGALDAWPLVGAWYTVVSRFVFPILALLILIRAIRSLLTVPHLPEVWAYLTLPNGARAPLTHWENILGRADACDVPLNYPVVSRQHAALIRGEGDVWTAYDLASTGGLSVNGKGGVVVLTAKDVGALASPAAPVVGQMLVVESINQETGEIQLKTVEPPANRGDGYVRMLTEIPIEERTPNTLYALVRGEASEPQIMTTNV